jgi:hypothetical protein
MAWHTTTTSAAQSGQYLFQRTHIDLVLLQGSLLANSTAQLIDAHPAAPTVVAECGGRSVRANWELGLFLIGLDFLDGIVELLIFVGGIEHGKHFFQIQIQAALTFFHLLWWSSGERSFRNRRGR